MSDAALPPEETTLPEPSNGGARGTDGATEAGGPVPTGFELDDDGMPPVEVLRQAMKAVVDPEIGYNVVDLGLVYDIEKHGDGQVKVVMTLTTMGCPLTDLIDQQVSVILGSLPGVDNVDVEFTFSPPWTPAMMSEDVRLEMRAMGMNV